MQQFIKKSSNVMVPKTFSKTEASQKSQNSKKRKRIISFFRLIFIVCFSTGLFAQTDNPSITIVNNTGYPIISAFLATQASENWGSNRLGGVDIISNGQSFSLRLPNALNVVNRYDIRLNDLNGVTYVQKNVLVSANSRVVFTKDDDESKIASSQNETSSKDEEDEIITFWGIRGGYNFTRITGKEISTDLKPGFQIGMVWERFFSDFPNISSVNGLLFTTQGCQGSTSFLGKTLGANETVKMNLNYLQYQSNIQLITDWGNTNLYARIGLYVSCAVGGKLKVEESGGITKEEKIKFGAAKDMRRWDFGWCFGTGLEFGITQVGLEFVNGFINLIPEGKHKLTNTGGAITLTFLF